jgi:glutathione S-transferase
LRLYGSSRSPFVRKVLVFAHETGLAGAVRLVPATVGLALPDPALMAISPLNRIPALCTDAGLVLCDSSLICEYLDSLHGAERLIPAGGEERWRVLQWNALAGGMLEQLVLWRFELLREPAARSEPLVAALELKVRSGLARFEADLPRLCERAFSIAHIALGCVLGYLDFRFAALDWRSAHPGLDPWHAALAERPSFQRTVHHDPSKT